MNNSINIYYNLKKKSLWVNEALESLKEDINMKEIVLNADDGSPEYIVDKIKMNFNERCLLAEIRTEIVREYPDISAPQSAIIRAAIFNRLFCKF